jgi:lysophospholipase L1-like esterase
MQIHFIAALAGVLLLASTQAAEAPVPIIPSTGFPGLDGYRRARIAVFTDDYGELGRYRADNARVKAQPEAHRVVFFGDSITDGWNLAKYFPGKAYVNRGIGGQTTSQMLVRFRQDVIDLKPEAVMILAGSNDIAGNSGPIRDEDIEANLATFIDLARAHGIRVVVGSVIPVHDHNPRAQELFAQRPPARIRAMNERTRTLCTREKVPYLDYAAAMVDGSGLLRKELADDGLHPNDAGYRVMAPLAEAALAQVLGR